MYGLCLKLFVSLFAETINKQMNTPATTLADIKTLVKKLHLSRMMERLEELYADPSVQERASEILCPWDNRSPPIGCIQ